MKYFNKLLKIFGNLSRLRNIFILVILSRLVFLEPNQLALIAEIVGSIVMLMATSPEDSNSFND